MVVDWNSKPRLTPFDTVLGTTFGEFVSAREGTDATA